MAPAPAERSQRNTWPQGILTPPPDADGSSSPASRAWNSRIPRPGSPSRNWRPSAEPAPAQEPERPAAGAARRPRGGEHELQQRDATAHAPIQLKAARQRLDERYSGARERETLSSCDERVVRGAACPSEYDYLEGRLRSQPVVHAVRQDSQARAFVAVPGDRQLSRPHGTLATLNGRRERVDARPYLRRGGS